MDKELRDAIADKVFEIRRVFSSSMANPDFCSSCNRYEGNDEPDCEYCLAERIIDLL